MGANLNKKDVLLATKGVVQPLCFCAVDNPTKRTVERLCGGERSGLF
jgi:hypothetical protein